MGCEDISLAVLSQGGEAIWLGVFRPGGCASARGAVLEEKDGPLEKLQKPYQTALGILARLSVPGAQWISRTLSRAWVFGQSSFICLRVPLEKPLEGEGATHGASNEGLCVCVHTGLVLR